MIYKNYGKTGKKVSAVGFGGMRFDLEKSNEENAQLLHYASQKGINYFDTAPGYCDDKSEDIFGIALSQMKREDYFVSTKRMPEHAKNKQEHFDLIKKSLDRLKSDYIDFFHMWCLRKPDDYTKAIEGGLYEALLMAQEQGLVKHIVYSSHQPGSQIKDIVTDGKVEGVLMGVNVLNSQYRWDGVEACAKSDLGVVAMNPLGGGIIPNNEDRFRFLCAKGESPVEAALRFVISSPQITVALNGITTKEHIDMANKVADNAQEMSQAKLEEIRNHVGENMNAVCTACGYCMPCPADLNIPAFMQVYNSKQMFDKSDEDMADAVKGARSWGLLVASEVHANECIQCGNCERACTQHLNIIDRLEEVAKWEEMAKV